MAKQIAVILALMKMFREMLKQPKAEFQRKVVHYVVNIYNYCKCKDRFVKSDNKHGTKAANIKFVS